MNKGLTEHFDSTQHAAYFNWGMIYYNSSCPIEHHILLNYSKSHNFNLMYVSFWFSCFVWSELIMLCFQQRYCQLIFNLICCGKINNWGKEGGAVICVLKNSIT